MVITEAILGTVIAELLAVVREEVGTMGEFDSTLREMEAILDAIEPILKEIDHLDKKLDRQDSQKNPWWDKLSGGKKLIQDCKSEMSGCCFCLKRSQYLKRFRELEASLKRCLDIVQLQTKRDTAKILDKLNEFDEKLGKFAGGQNPGVQGAPLVSAGNGPGQISQPKPSDQPEQGPQLPRHSDPDGEPPEAQVQVSKSKDDSKAEINDDQGNPDKKSAVVVPREAQAHPSGCPSSEPQREKEEHGEEGASASSKLASSSNPPVSPAKERDFQESREGDSPGVRFQNSHPREDGFIEADNIISDNTASPIKQPEPSTTEISPIEQAGLRSEDHGTGAYSHTSRHFQSSEEVKDTMPKVQGHPVSEMAKSSSDFAATSQKSPRPTVPERREQPRIPVDHFRNVTPTRSASKSSRSQPSSFHPSQPAASSEVKEAGEQTSHTSASINTGYSVPGDEHLDELASLSPSRQVHTRAKPPEVRKNAEDKKDVGKGVKKDHRNAHQEAGCPSDEKM